MTNTIISCICILFLSFVFSFYSTNSQGQEDTELQTYIVHVRLPEDQILSEKQDLTAYYKSFLPEATDLSNGPQPAIIYSYHHVVTGFAAKLTAAHVKSMEKKEGFLRARPQRILSLHTTYSPNFLGLQQNSGFWQGSNYGKGVIIGVLDSGITPNHPSFNDEGLPPPPKKWKGKCEFEKTSCNNKLIGAMSFGPNKTDPLDTEGHGTHTSSTAAGNFVKGANVFGLANGTAVGIAPLAHVAMYKVCSKVGCAEPDILAGMEAAIDDGVDVLSLSIGGDAPSFYSDEIAIGAFKAIQNGIFVSCSAGNSGPAIQSLSNGAPWILTVGASTIDRKIRSTAVLGNQNHYDGETLFQPSDFPPNQLPLVYAGDKNSPVCGPRSFSETDVKGKVVLCERGGGIGRIAKGRAVKAAGGVGMILMNGDTDRYSIIADSHVLPAVHVSYAAGLEIKKYISSTAKPTAGILFKGTVIGEKKAPEVASFSSRGPNPQSLGILKPDIIGPGVNIIAAWPVSVQNERGTTSTFNVISGTSMSCPHLSGIAALIKNAHPDWSPAAIKSAIMTTADITNLENKPIVDETQNPANLFAIGAGHVNPSRTTDPGIIYDLKPDDYIPYLCGLNYDDRDIESITNTIVNCSALTVIKEAELNYPSFAVTLGGDNITFTRTVTNVGPAKSSYTPFITNPPGVGVTVKEKTLEFSNANQKLTYEVTFSRLSSAPSQTYVQGYIKWVSQTSKHYALSPISVQLEPSQ